MDLSVVLVARNDGATIGGQLEALASQAFDGSWEVVVVDRASTDATRQVVDARRRLFAHLTVVPVPATAGVNAARNAGIGAAAGRHVLLCDAGDLVGAGWLSAMDRALEADDLVGGPVEEHSLARPGVGVFNPRPEMTDNPSVPGFMRYALGCNCGLRRRTWERIGGFDEEWRRGSTEIEFFLRAQLVGATLGFVPAALVARRPAPSLREQRREVVLAGASHARLYSGFGDAGMPRRPLRSIVGSWLWLAARAPWLLSRDPKRRRKWQKVFAWYLGRLGGSVRWRVFSL